MTDSTIRLKRRAIGSLAFRILTVSILLLVIPLLLQSLFLYKQEYKEKLSDVRENLQILAQERSRLVEEMIQLNWAILDVYKEGDVKRVYIEKIPLPQGVAENFAILNSDVILVGKKETSATALVITIPISQVTHDLPTLIPVDLALVNQKSALTSSTIQILEPIPQTNFFLQLTVKKSSIHGLHLQAYYFRFTSLLFFVGVIGGGCVYLFTRRIARPLKNLCKTMDRVSEGAAHVRYSPDKWGFEINALGLQFNETLDRLLSHAEAAERERIKREKLAEELKIGHEIQASLIPSGISLKGLDIASSYLAAKEVNGDFYDLFRLEDEKVLLVICDSAGKGISGCLYSLGLRSMIRSFASVIPKVAEIVRRTNDLFWLDAYESAMFSTLWLGLYDPKTKRLSYCSQGHPPALLKRGVQLQELWTEGIALGAQKVDVIATKEIILQEEDVLVLYTDGIIEAHDRENRLFGKKRLEEFLLSKKTETAQQMAEQLIEKVHLFDSGTPQHDDMTLVVIRISGV